MTTLRISKTDFEARTRLEEELLRRRRAPGAAAPPAEGGAGPDGALRLRASPAQEGMWHSLNGGPGSTPPLLIGGARLLGPLDTEAFEEAWNDVVARHDSLRSTLRMRDGRLDLVVAPSARLPVPVLPLAPEDFARFTKQESDEPVDLAAGPLARLRLLRLADEEHIAFLAVHHIIGDGRTLEVLVRDLTVCYLARIAGESPELPPLPLRYAEFAARHRELVEGPRGAELTAYWLDRLRGARPAVLPTDLRPTAQPSRLGASVSVALPADLFRRLTEAARSRHTTLYTIGLTAFQVLLARESGQRDICVRAPITYRDDPDVQDMVADFSNDVIARTDLSDNPTFSELVETVRRDTVRDFGHHELPPHLLVPHMEDPGLLDRLFHVQFTAEREFGLRFSAGRLRTEPVEPPDPYVSRPLSMRLRHDDDGARCLVMYAVDLFSESRVRRLVEDWFALIAELADHPDRPALG